MSREQIAQSTFLCVFLIDKMWLKLYHDLIIINGKKVTFMIILLFALWLLLNGRFTADAGMLQICITGAATAAFAYFIAYRFLGITPSKELKICKKLPLMIVYVFVLIKEIIVSNLYMAKLILGKKDSFTPVIVRVKIPLKTNLCKVILANSITLTPGTITADFEGDVFTVHCIDRKLGEGLESSSFVKILERLEK